MILRCAILLPKISELIESTRDAMGQLPADSRELDICLGRLMALQEIKDAILEKDL